MFPALAPNSTPSITSSVPSRTAQTIREDETSSQTTITPGRHIGSSPPKQPEARQYSQLSERNKILYNQALSPEEAGSPISTAWSTPPSPTPVREGNPAASRRPSKVTKPSASRWTSTTSGAKSVGLASVKAKYHPQASQPPPRRASGSGVKAPKASQPPRPPSPATLLNKKAKVEWQIGMAQHLTYMGISGPYEIGDYLCDIRADTGEPVKRATRRYNDREGWIWQNLLTGGPVREQMFDYEQCGIPIEGPGGSFVGLRNDHVALRPQGIVSTADLEKPFRSEQDNFKSSFRIDDDPMWY